MKPIRFFAGVLLLGGALVAGAAFAQDPGPDGGGRGPGFGGPGFGGPGPGRRGGFGRDGGFFLRGIDLTDAQRQQIRELVAQQREQNRELVSQLRAAHEAERKAVEATPINEQAIRAAAHAVANTQAELAIRQARLRAEIFALLTPEQRAEADKRGAERKARRSQMRERMQPR